MVLVAVGGILMSTLYQAISMADDRCFDDSGSRQAVNVEFIIVSDLRIVSGQLQRRTPTLSCDAVPISLTLRLAHDGVTKTSAPGRAVGGGAYFGAAAGAGQRTPFLLHVSPDGRSVTNRLAQLFVDCAAKKPYEYFSLNDFTRFPIDTDGRFSAKETWTTDADHIGLDPKHTLVVSTRTDGASKERTW